MSAPAPAAAVSAAPDAASTVEAAPSASPAATAGAVAPAPATSVVATPAAAAAEPAVAVPPPARPLAFPVRPVTAEAVVPAGAARPVDPVDAGSIGGAVFSLVLVLGLILGLGWLARRMPGLQRGAGAASHLRVVASLALGARERAVVVEVGETQMLLGVGTGGVRMLHVLDRPLPAEGATAPSPFAQVLAQHFGRKG